MKEAVAFERAYRFRTGDKVTAILDKNGKLNLKDEAGGLEQFPSWRDYVKDVQKEKPETGNETDILDQLSNTLGDYEEIESTVEAPKQKLNPKAKAEGTKEEKVDKTMATKKAEKPLKKAAPAKEAAPCHCGCGRDTFGKAGFAPGHDARVHGWGKKIADGRLTFAGINKELNPEIKDKGVAATTWLKEHGVKQGKPAKAEK